MERYETPTITTYKLSEETEDYFPSIEIFFKGIKKVLVLEENNNLRVY